ncbi:MAG TPA: Pls/PosA family non-ribosomal peptide synthetase [Streptosporangiaceae bacterium]|nr:Pls/PosA family non-ribosomal peptide synthetase [Streptosporangiaceae bacterium]
MDKPAEVLTAAQPEAPAAGTQRAGPPADAEREFARLLAGVVHADSVPADSHFFDDLGADSMVMARFCARVRKRADLPSVSMQDIYRHPTIASLAAALDTEAAAPASPALPATAGSAPAAPPPAGQPRRARTSAYLLCGTLQLLIFLGYCYLVAVIAVRGYDWISAGAGSLGIYPRAVVFGAGSMLVLCTLPIAAKWLLIGRWKPQQLPVWSLRYVRFWFVKTLIRANPLAILFGGSPLYVLYLRALGARIGRGVTILSRNVPVCTDLLQIGAGTVIRKDSFFPCYRAHAGQILTGPVTIGRDAYIGERTVLDIGSSMGDGAQLGHTSALYDGRAVPPGERWHGSPAQPADLDYRRVAPARCSTLRRLRYSAVSLFFVLFLYLPLLEGVVYLLLAKVPALSELKAQADAITSSQLLLSSLLSSAVLFLGGLLAGLVTVITVPRVLGRFLRPGRVYPLFGIRDRIHRAISSLTNVRFFMHLFGDSSYIVGYFRWIGYDLSEVEQTGSNFGTEVAHDTPLLSRVGSGTMVADGLSIINADYSGTSFRVSPVRIGAHNFVGNHIAYPAGGRTGDNCLLATKAMIPLDGEIRSGTGLLGSPPFEIPRTVERDASFDHLRTGAELRRRLTAKNKYNIATMGVFLFTRWVEVFLLILLAQAAVFFYSGPAYLGVAGVFALSVLASAAYFVLVERAVARFRRMRPRFCSIYDRYFWWHERMWKVPAPEYLRLFDGTPFKNLVWRLLGVRIGRRVFDDGCYLTERTLVTVGDDCTLNFGSTLQCHSQEDGTFKSDRTTIGSGCTLAVGALVHYGVTVGDGAQLAPDSFLMKGEEVPPRAHWGGNPAREL